jgi:hypothetical protein
VQLFAELAAGLVENVHRVGRDERPGERGNAVGVVGGAGARMRRMRETIVGRGLIVDERRFGGVGPCRGRRAAVGGVGYFLPTC